MWKSTISNKTTTERSKSNKPWPTFDENKFLTNRRTVAFDEIFRWRNFFAIQYLSTSWPRPETHLTDDSLHNRSIELSSSPDQWEIWTSFTGLSFLKPFYCFLYHGDQIISWWRIYRWLVVDSKIHVCGQGETSEIAACDPRGVVGLDYCDRPDFVRRLENVLEIVLTFLHCVFSWRKSWPRHNPSRKSIPSSCSSRSPDRKSAPQQRKTIADPFSERLHRRQGWGGGGGVSPVYYHWSWEVK